MSTTSSTTNCKVFWPAPVCSGNGVCDESIGKCICKAGWTSIGDYALEEGADCNINLTAVTALWSIDLISYLITFVLMIGFFYIRCFKSKAPILLSDPAFQNPLFFTISVVSHVILGCLRVSSPSKRVIGGDPATTVAYMFGSCFASWTTLSFIQLNSRFLLSIVKTMPEKSKKRIRMQIKAFNNGLPIAYTLGVIGSAMPMFGLGFPQHIFWFAFTYHFIIAVPIIAFVSFGMNNILSPTLKEIENHINSCKASNSTQDIQIFIDIHNKLTVSKKQSNIACMCISVFFLILGSWPYLTRNGSYATPITSIFGATSIVNVWALSNPKKESDTSDVGDQREGKNTLSVTNNNINGLATGITTNPSNSNQRDVNPSSSIHPSTGNN